MITVTNLLKRSALIALAALTILITAFACFIFLAPRSGAGPEGERLVRIHKSPNFSDGEFQNPTETVVGGRGAGVMVGAIYDWLFAGTERAPQQELPVGFASSIDQFTLDDSAITVTWFGHSTVLITIENRRILFDPMFSESAAPLPYLGQRFPVEREFDIDDLPRLDAVVISHDHYDHLDHESARILAAKTSRFFAPLGVGAHLESWGIAPENIVELDWWDSVDFAGLTFSATPARHFSGRRFPAANTTLWASWVIAGTRQNVFFSGDSGYFRGFKEIGARFGPFDFCMVECGQYSENWPDVHMMPEETVQAQLDLGGALLMPIHWGAFDLSLHSWNEPPRRMLNAAIKANVRVALPLIGQTFSVDDPPQERWWENVR